MLISLLIVGLASVSTLTVFNIPYTGATDRGGPPVVSFYAGCSVGSVSGTGELIVEVRTTERGGKIYVGIQNGEQFMTNRYMASRVADNLDGRQIIRFADLPCGETVSVTVFQDMNNNRRLDRNQLGIPTEPFGFSRNVKVKFNQPRFGETAIELKPGLNTTTIDLYRWCI